MYSNLDLGHRGHTETCLTAKPALMASAMVAGPRSFTARSASSNSLGTL
jgi:hypothetical protein